MKTQAENSESYGLGKKVEPREVIKPDWTKVPGKPHHYVNAKGDRKYVPPVPDCPSHPTPFDLWAADIQKALKEAQDILNTPEEQP